MGGVIDTQTGPKSFKIAMPYRVCAQQDNGQKTDYFESKVDNERGTWLLAKASCE